MQVETQLAKLASLLDLKKATPKAPAPAAAKPQEQQPGEEAQLGAGHTASLDGRDGEENRAPSAHRHKKQKKQKMQVADS